MRQASNSLANLAYRLLSTESGPRNSRRFLLPVQAEPALPSACHPRARGFASLFISSIANVPATTTKTVRPDPSLANGRACRQRSESHLGAVPIGRQQRHPIVRVCRGDAGARTLETRVRGTLRLARRRQRRGVVHARSWVHRLREMSLNGRSGLARTRVAWPSALSPHRIS